MKAHYVGMTSRERKIVTKIAADTATRLANEQKEAIAIRSQYLIFVAMLECGLSPKTVNRVAGMLSLVKDKYAHYNEDQLADYVFYQHLQDHGVNVKKTAEVDLPPFSAPDTTRCSRKPKAPEKQTEEQKNES